MFHILLGAWWEVDLGSNFEVASVEVTNRQDCCGYRLRNSDVVLKLDDDTPFATFHIATATDGEVFGIPASSFVSNLLFARKVRIQLRGKEALNLQLVKVYDISGNNVADPAENSKATANQLSNYADDNSYGATNAIDSSEYMSHTKFEQGKELFQSIEISYERY